jgi:hypothetical protein
MMEKDDLTVQKELLTRRAWLTKGFKTAAALGLGAIALNALGDLNPSVTRAIEKMTSGALDFTSADTCVLTCAATLGPCYYAANLIWYVQGSTAGFSALQFGLSTDNAAPGDYDGDGKFDPAVYRPGASSAAQSYYYIRRSSDQVVQVYPWGLGGDVVVPGDYDGDGKTDPAILRRGATNQVWYALKSSTGDLIALTFGLTESDFPVQNDYDGDAKTDIGVWRETDGNFYIFRSSDGNLGVVGWGWLSDLPIAGYDAH